MCLHIFLFNYITKSEKWTIVSYLSLSLHIVKSSDFRKYIYLIINNSYSEAGKARTYIVKGEEITLSKPQPYGIFAIKYLINS